MLKLEKSKRCIWKWLIFEDFPVQSYNSISGPENQKYPIFVGVFKVHLGVQSYHFKHGKVILKFERMKIRHAVIFVTIKWTRISLFLGPDFVLHNLLIIYVKKYWIEHKWSYFSNQPSSLLLHSSEFNNAQTLSYIMFFMTKRITFPIRYRIF